MKQPQNPSEFRPVALRIAILAGLAIFITLLVVCWIRSESTTDFFFAQREYQEAGQLQSQVNRLSWESGELEFVRLQGNAAFPVGFEKEFAASLHYKGCPLAIQPCVVAETTISIDLTTFVRRQSWAHLSVALDWLLPQRVPPTTDFNFSSPAGSLQRSQRSR